LRESTFVTLQHWLPKLALTRFAGALAGWRGGVMTHWIVRRFVAKYGVNMAEALEPRIESYATFNEFFTRPLRGDARPLPVDGEASTGEDASTWLCPVDGAISQFGAIERDQIFQAKGHHYSTQALVGGDAALAAHFEGGAFATLYLSPRDYHRIHMPCDGTLKRMIHVPGALYSVNPATARGIPGLFAINERVVCVFETAHGPFVLTLVGATIVGSMATVWHGVVNPPRSGIVREWRYGTGEGDEPPVTIKRGDEMGRFLLGSTVVMLWPKNVLQFNPAWIPTGAIRLNEVMATRVAS
jgi:phosphatidylserine decarboxylase